MPYFISYVVCRQNTQYRVKINVPAAPATSKVIEFHNSLAFSNATVEGNGSNNPTSSLNTLMLLNEKQTVKYSFRASNVVILLKKDPVKTM